MGPEGWQTACQIAIAAGLIMTGLGGYGSWHFGKKIDQDKFTTQERFPMEKVKIADSYLDKSPVIVDSPGANVDYSTKVNILTDKETLGIREPSGLYRDGKKVATVVNPVFDKATSSFKCDSVRFSEPLNGNTVNLDSFDGPYEFQNFQIQVSHYNSLSTFPTPLLREVTGKIIAIR